MWQTSTALDRRTKRRSSKSHLANESAFTLIELLVVIGVLATLATAIVLVLNPAELLKEGRDSTRLSDLASLNSALSLFQVDQYNQSLGVTNTVYVSVPDSSPTCANLGLATLPSGWAYACSSAANYQKVDGTGWIPVNLALLSTGSPLPKFPVDPINTTSTGNYYAYTPGGSWELKAVLESAKYSTKAQSDGGVFNNSYEIGSSLALMPYVYPDNWVKVPGNSSFGTSDFWVMKYEAKCVQTSGNAPLGTPGANYDTTYRTYSDSGYPCTSGNGKYVASAPDGFPIANVSHNTALSYCSSLGVHLLTNDEYMTIVRNAEQVSSNWSGGSPGSGYLYSGHNDNAPAYALPADPSDANGYSGETNTGGNQRRTLTLSNGSVVWDFAGNIWQHVQRSVNNVGDLTTTMALPACSNSTAGWEWCEYASPGSPYVSAWSSDVAQAKVGPSNTSWHSAYGVGQVYTYGTGANQGTTVFLRGGSWSYGSFAGAFTLSLNWFSGTTVSYVGFRCAR